MASDDSDVLSQLGDGSTRSNCVLSHAPASHQSVILSVKHAQAKRLTYIEALCFGKGACKI